MLTFAGIIPARYASTRFPGKPLALIRNKPMIAWVYERASEVLEMVYVATDDHRIADAVIRFGGNVILTSPHHQSGTDRCAEAAGILERDQQKSFDVIINIQGDEPFIRPEPLNQLMRCFDSRLADIATLIKPIHTAEDLFNPNCVKVVTGSDNKALYFSRSPIPFLRNADKPEWHTKFQYFKHLGIYAYRSDVLKEITRLAPSALERAESLEQLRWIENGYCVVAEKTDFESISVDTPEDLEKINRMDFRM